MKFKITNGICIIDKEFYPLAKEASWRLSNWGYAVTNSFWDKEFKKASTVTMHRFILGISDKNIHIDHVNRNKLDNRLSNLRAVLPCENSWNRAADSDNISGFKGVTKDCRRNKWIARICVNGKTYFLGHFDSHTDAAHAYNKSAAIWHKEFAFKNDVR